MTMRTWITLWWINDPGVTPCPRCRCPLQAPNRLSMAEVMQAHYETVHPGVSVHLVPSGGAR